MPSFLEVLAHDAENTVAAGYYDVDQTYPRMDVRLSESIMKCKKNAIITEIKTASPSTGIIIRDIDAEATALMMQRGGAAGLSVLTEPKHFRGKIDYLVAAGKSGLPRLMKDIIIDPIQLKAAAKIGAEAVLLIKSLFEKSLSNLSLEEMIFCAHEQGIEVLLETHTREEFEDALETEADLIGINNRDLSTMKTDLETTPRILSGCDVRGRIIVSESGVSTADHVRLLRESGVRAALVGSSIMSSPSIESKVRELVEA